MYAIPHKKRYMCYEITRHIQQQKKKRKINDCDADYQFLPKIASK